MLLNNQRNMPFAKKLQKEKYHKPLKGEHIRGTKLRKKDILELQK